MKKTLLSLALCGLALTVAGVARAADGSGRPSDLPWDAVRYPWEANLEENVAVRAVLNQQATGIEYGTDLLGDMDGR